MEMCIENECGNAVAQETQDALLYGGAIWCVGHLIARARVHGHNIGTLADLVAWTRDEIPQRTDRMLSQFRDGSFERA